MADPKASDDILLLRQIVRWTRHAALPQFRERGAEILDTDSKKRVYQAMEPGTATVSVIESTTGANHNDVRAWARAWEAEGFVEPESSPPKASFSLVELRITPPPPKAERPRKGTGK